MERFKKNPSDSKAVMVRTCPVRIAAIVDYQVIKKGVMRTPFLLLSIRLLKALSYGIEPRLQRVSQDRVQRAAGGQQ